MLEFSGTQFKIYPNDILGQKTEYKQFKFPKSKKKRIRIKWAKNRKNWKSFTVEVAVKVGNAIYVSKKTYGLLLEKWKNSLLKTELSSGLL